MKLRIPPIQIFLFLVISICVVVFLLHYLIVGQATYGDGRAYYSYLLSLYKDMDFNMVNQVTHHWEPSNNNSLTPINTQALFYIPENAVGTSLFWLPALFVSVQISKIVNFIFSLNLPLHGYSHISQITVGVSTVLIGVLGLYYSFRSLRLYFKNNLSILAILFLWLSTNLFYYTSIDVLNSHPISFFLTAFTLFCILKDPLIPTSRNLLRFGFLLGLVFIVREQDLLTLLPIFLYRVFQNTQSLTKVLSKLPIFLIAFLLPLSVQFIYNLQNFGSILHPHFYLRQWRIPSLIDFLISPRRGSILVYSPSLLLAAYGLVRTRIPNKKIFLFTILFQIVLSSAWNEGSSYGPRTLIATYPMFAFGFAEILKDKRAKFLLMALALINFVTIFGFLLFATGSNSSGFDPVTLQRINQMIGAVFP